MLNLFNIEHQANKRVHRFMIHQATEKNMEPANAKLVINSLQGKIAVHFYNQHTCVETLSIKLIVEFFGGEYDEDKATKGHEYLVKISKENNIELAKSNVVICENKGRPGAHLYNAAKYVKRLSTIELVTAVIKNE